MADDPRYNKPRNWPQEMLDRLEPFGITPYDTLDTIKPKLEAAGFRIVEMNVDRGGILSTPLYHAAVYGSEPGDRIKGESWSETDYVEALAEAADRILLEREIWKRVAQRLEDESAAADSEPS